MANFDGLICPIFPNVITSILFFLLFSSILFSSLLASPSPSPFPYSSSLFPLALLNRFFLASPIRTRGGGEGGEDGEGGEGGEGNC